MKATRILFALVSSLACVLAAHADTITGDIAVSGSGTFTASSLQLNSSAFVESSTGDLSSADSESLATLYVTPLTGLSGTATTYSTPIASYFQLSSAVGFLGSTGTTPANRFVFALSSITETNSTVGDYSGAGILTDTTGAFAPTLATFTLGNSGTPGGPSGLGFTLSADGVAAAATPEPSVWALFAFGCGFLVFLRSKRRRA